MPERAEYDEAIKLQFQKSSINQILRQVILSRGTEPRDNNVQHILIILDKRRLCALIL